MIPQNSSLSQKHIDELHICEKAIKALTDIMVTRGNKHYQLLFVESQI